MANLSFSGLAGVTIGGACAYGLGHYLVAAGQEPLQAGAWGLLAGCFAASMFGLLYDRSVVPEFRRSYKVLTRHLIPRERTGPDYDPRERVAVLAIPVAFATMIPPVLTLFLGILEWNAPWHVHPILHGDDNWVLIYFIATVGAAVLTFVIGGATAEHRLLQREISFNVAPAVADNGKPAAAGSGTGTKGARTATVGPPTEAQLAQLRRRGRRDAVFVILGGLVLLLLNHYSAIHEHRIYMKAVFGAPMIIACGIFSLFQPLIMTRHKPIGKYYPRSVLMLTFLAMAIGVGAGYELYSWYQG